MISLAPMRAYDQVVIKLSLLAAVVCGGYALPVLGAPISLGETDRSLAMLNGSNDAADDWSYSKLGVENTIKVDGANVSAYEDSININSELHAYIRQLLCIWPSSPVGGTLIRTDGSTQPCGAPWRNLQQIKNKLGGPSDSISDLKKFVDDYDQVYDEEKVPKTVLRGESIFGLETINNLERVDGEEPNGKNYYIGYRLRLNIDTTFFEKDRLRIRLQSRTLPELEDITGSPLTNLSFDGDTQDAVEISDVWYRFPWGKNTEINLTVVGGSLRDNVPVVNPLFTGSSRGSISVFGSEDPIIRSPSGAGLGISHDFNKSLNLSAAYISRRAEDSSQGIFGDRLSSIIQLTYQPQKNFTASLSTTYTLNDGFLRNQFDDSDSVSGLSLSAEMYYRITDLFALGVRGGIIEAKATDLEDSPRKQIASFAVTLGFPDLWGKGNLLGIVIGQPPALIFDSDEDINNTKPQHFELFYRYTISDYLSVTPGALYVLAPDESGGGIGYWIGALRMTFRF